MIGKYLDTCTNHLTSETVDALVEGNIPYTTAYPYEEGLFIIIPDIEDEPDDIERPEDLESLFYYARIRGCSIVRLDRDAEELDDLRTYEW